MLKVTDFGTSRFLEIAAHGTTVIGSPPYMAPEQFHGKAVFASDVYSVGVTMYQMLTGELPYDTPAPGDIERLMRGELVTPPRVEEREDPEGHQRHRPAGARARPHRRATSAPPTCSTTCWRPRDRRSPAPGPARRRRRRRPTTGRRHPVAAQGARDAAGRVLLALPQAAARPDGQVPVLRRIAVSAE